MAAETPELHEITRDQLFSVAEAQYRTFLVVPNWSVNPSFPPRNAWEDLSESIRYTYASRMQMALAAIGIILEGGEEL